MTSHAVEASGESQARRLERVYEQVAGLLRRPSVASRLRTAPGESEWSAMQTLGHMTEMVPYWLNHCRVLIAATGDPPLGRRAGLAGATDGESPTARRLTPTRR